MPTGGSRSGCRRAVSRIERGPREPRRPVRPRGWSRGSTAGRRRTQAQDVPHAPSAPAGTGRSSRPTGSGPGPSSPKVTEFVGRGRTRGRSAHRGGATAWISHAKRKDHVHSATQTLPSRGRRVEARARSPSCGLSGTRWRFVTFRGPAAGVPARPQPAGTSVGCRRDGECHRCRRLQSRCAQCARLGRACGVGAGGSLDVGIALVLRAWQVSHGEDPATLRQDFERGVAQLLRPSPGPTAPSAHTRPGPLPGWSAGWSAASG